jgi:hypothetical protein
MKTLITAATVMALLSVPAFAEGEDGSTKAGEAKGNLKATTEQKQEPIGSNSMGQGATVPRTTTGASSRTTNELNKEENSSPANPGQKTGVSGGNDGGGGSGGSGGGSGGSGGGSGGGGGGSR